MLTDFWHITSFIYVMLLFGYSKGKPASDLKTTESLFVVTLFCLACINKYCPLGTYCEERNVVKCGKPPCRPILICLPENENGCAHTVCSNGLVCVERTIPCIGKICKKVARCIPPGTCDALVCPPSHRCESSPSPHCVRGIFTISEVARIAQGLPVNSPNNQ